jgi:hypothetical protein
MSKYQVRDTSTGEDYEPIEIPFTGTKDECDQWAERHNRKVINAGGDECFVVEKIQHYVVHGYINYVGRVSVEAGSEAEARQKFEQETSVDDVNIKGGEGFVAVEAEVIQ